VFENTAMLASYNWEINNAFCYSPFEL